MNRHELASLLSQTQSMMAGPNHQSSVSAPLSPRQKFQAHVRTLSENPPSSRHASIAPRPSSQLQRVSSLRAHQSESPSPTRPSPIWRHSESALKTFAAEPQFITEEREVWGRPSPFRSVKSFSAHESRLQQTEEQSPIQHSHRRQEELRLFAPLSQPIDVNDRPKTSRGYRPGLASHVSGLESLPHDKDDLGRASKFAEGSMNDRSAGVSSAWTERGSLASISGTDESDNDSTPRPSPVRSSVDINEFNPQSVAATTFAQRLFKFGTKAKSRDASKHELGKTESEPQTVRKKKGLRKSMSMWTLHGDKKKTASQLNLNNASPQKQPPRPAQTSDIDVLNDRKRRAEEAYAQQFGMKRRKSNVGLPANSEASKQASAAAQVGTPPKVAPNSGRRRLSWSSSTTFSTDFDVFDGESDVDLQKRPSRRELEKENQQLRALLRQQQEGVWSKRKTRQSTSPSSRALPKTPAGGHDAANNQPCKSSATRHSQQPLQLEQPSVPPVPALSPELRALKPLSNTRNIPRQQSSQEDLKTIFENASDRCRPTNVQSRKATAKHSRRASLARGAEPPRVVSMILEQDEESESEKKSAKENRHPLKNFPKLIPTPVGSPKKCAVIENGAKATVEGSTAEQRKGVKSEKWEWPDDVF